MYQNQKLQSNCSVKTKTYMKCQPVTLLYKQTRPITSGPNLGHSAIYCNFLIFLSRIFNNLCSFRFIIHSGNAFLCSFVTACSGLLITWIFADGITPYLHISITWVSCLFIMMFMFFLIIYAISNFFIHRSNVRYIMPNVMNIFVD